MSNPEFQVGFGVKGEDVLSALGEAGIHLTDVYLVDEKVFKGVYNGSGECPEWLGLGLGYLDNFSPFVDMDEITSQNNSEVKDEHLKGFMMEVEKLVKWLEDKGYTLACGLDLPKPEYFIACGTD